MKRYFKLMIIFLSMCILVLSASPVQAATAKLSTVDSVTEGETIKVTVNVNAAQWNLTLTANGKTLNTWTETVNYKENLSKTFTASYKATEKGTVNFVLQGDITDVNQENTEINASKSVTVKAKTNSSGNSGSSGSSSNGGSGSTTTKPKAPTFANANKTVYTTNDCNLRSSWSTSSSAIEVGKGTELKLTGTSTETINGYKWYRVNYNGATKYIASSLITETKPKEDDEKNTEKSSNKNLSSLSIEGIELTPAFDKETTNYTAKVDGDVTELKINAKAEESKAKVAIEGNEELKEGDNVIKVKVTAEDDTTRTYFITVTKGEGTTADTTLKLSELKIERVNFEESFSPDTYTYELSLNTYVENLEITATPNQADAKVEITGNSNFKSGKNVVTILLTSADGKQTATYQIQVNLQEELITEEKNEPDMIIYIIVGIAIAIAIIAIFLIIKHCVANKKQSTVEDDDMDSKLSSEYIDGEKEISETKKSDLTSDNSLNDHEENQEKPKKQKGRHSM